MVAFTDQLQTKIVCISWKIGFKTTQKIRLKKFFFRIFSLIYLLYARTVNLINSKDDFNAVNLKCLRENTRISDKYGKKF